MRDSGRATDSYNKSTFRRSYCESSLSGEMALMCRSQYSKKGTPRRGGSVFRKSGRGRSSWNVGERESNSREAT